MSQLGAYSFWFTMYCVLSSTAASSLASFTTRSTICWRGIAVAMALRTWRSSRPGTVDSMSKCSHWGPSVVVYLAPSTASILRRRPIWFCGEIMSTSPERNAASSELVSRTGTNTTFGTLAIAPPQYCLLGTSVACWSGVNDCTIIGPLLIGFFVFGLQMQSFQTLLKFLPSRMCWGSTVVLAPAHSSRNGANTLLNTIWNSVGLTRLNALIWS